MQLKLHCVTIEDTVRSLYCKNNRRQGIDPVVLVKYLLVRVLYGIESERRIEQEITVNMAYRWFPVLDIDDRVSAHSTISQLRRRKFNGTDLFKELFAHVLKLCVEAGLVSGKLLLTDSIHVKANATKMVKVTVEIEQDMTEYLERLDVYEVEERERLGMPGITRSPPEPKKTKQTVSITDLETGWLNRPNKPEGFRLFIASDHRCSERDHCRCYGDRREHIGQHAVS